MAPPYGAAATALNKAPSRPGRQDLSGAQGTTIRGAHGGIQQLGAAAQRRLAQAAGGASATTQTAPPPSGPIAAPQGQTKPLALPGFMPAGAGQAVQNMRDTLNGGEAIPQYSGGGEQAVSSISSAMSPPMQLQNARGVRSFPPPSYSGGPDMPEGAMGGSVNPAMAAQLSQALTGGASGGAPGMSEMPGAGPKPGIPAGLPGFMRANGGALGGSPPSPGTGPNPSLLRPGMTKPLINGGVMEPPQPRPLAGGNVRPNGFNAGRGMGGFGR